MKGVMWKQPLSLDKKSTQVDGNPDIFSTLYCKFYNGGCALIPAGCHHHAGLFVTGTLSAVFKDKIQAK